MQNRSSIYKVCIFLLHYICQGHTNFLKSFLTLLPLCEKAILSCGVQKILKYKVFLFSSQTKYYSKIRSYAAGTEQMKVRPSSTRHIGISPVGRSIRGTLAVLQQKFSMQVKPDSPMLVPGYMKYRKTLQPFTYDSNDDFINI